MILILVTFVNCMPEPPTIPDCNMEFPASSFLSLQDRSGGCFIELVGGSYAEVTQSCDYIIRAGHLDKAAK